jgi:hypothetical protein
MAIPDNYQAVSVYLPPELAQKVKDYAIEHNLTRKSKAGDKPALGTAVIEILTSILDSPLPSRVPSQLPIKASQVPDNVLSNVLERLARLESLTSELLGTWIDPMTLPVSTLPSNVPELANHLPSQTLIESPELETSQPLEPDAHQSLSSTLPSTLPSQLPVEQILDPKQWDEPLAELVRTGISTTEIASELTQMGYTNSKGNPIDRKSIESKFKQHPDLKTAYNSARKPTAVEPTPPVPPEIPLTAAQAKDLQQINDRVGKVTKAKSKKLLDLGLIVQIGEDLILTKQGEKVLAKHQL